MQDKSYYPETESVDFKPVKIFEVEISQTLPPVNLLNESGQRAYQRVLVLVRLHHHPIGLIPVEFISEEISPEQLAEQLWHKCRDKINQHLQQDGLEKQTGLPAGGLEYNSRAKCREVRQEILKDAPLVSIVISTRDRVRSLTNTLNSILALEYPKVEVILVDNAPESDDTREYYDFIQPQFLRNNIRLEYIRENTPGLAIAHNRGLESVKGSIAAFTDDDVVVDRDWLVELVRGFGVAPNVGCVTGLVTPVELQTPAQVLFEEFGGFVKGFTQQIYDLDGNRPLDPLFPYTAGRFGTGANMSFRTDILRACGGFDPALGIGTPAQGADDMAAFFQMLIKGYQVVYQPSALIYHQHRQSFVSLRKQMFGYGTGLTAFITKIMLDNPRLIADVTLKIPAGIKYAFSPDSPKNLNKSKDYPRELEWIERKGMLYGPAAYLYSRWIYRKARRQSTTLKFKPGPPLPPHYRLGSWVEEVKGEKGAAEK